MSGPTRSLQSGGSTNRLTVALFPDTFTEFNEPEQGLAAVQVLEAIGCQVVVTPRLCCGRAALSNGLVPSARDRAERLIAALEPYADAGIPVLGLEPSCALTIRDDFPALVPGPATERVAANVLLFDEYLAQRLKENPSALQFRPNRQSARHYLVHGHCHQKALAGEEPTLSLLKAIPGARVASTAAGCCGMAGAFGYTAGHYDISRTIANDRLLPALRTAPNALIVANGTSCRHQIRDLGGRQAVHVAVVLAPLVIVSSQTGRPR